MRQYITKGKIMAIQKITGSEMREKIHSIADAKPGENNKILDEISDFGKGLINNLNAVDKTIYEISEDYDDCIKQLDNEEHAYDAAIKTQQNVDNEIVYIERRIEELEKKMENGEELTENESNELRNLYLLYSDRQYQSESLGKGINSMQNTLGVTSRKIGDYNATLQDAISSMNGYKDAGQEMINASETYGNAVDCEVIMERNETTWWDFFGLSDNDTNTLKYKYLSSAGYTEIAEDIQVYYSQTEGFLSEYDMLKNKGGNQMSGEDNHAKCKAFSYGKTLTVASDMIKNRASNIKKG